MPNVPESPRLVTLELLNVMFPAWSITLDPRLRVWFAEKRQGTQRHVLVAVDLDRLASKIDAAEAAEPGECTCDHGYPHRRDVGCTYPGCGCTFWAGP